MMRELLQSVFSFLSIRSSGSDGSPGKLRKVVIFVYLYIFAMVLFFTYYKFSRPSTTQLVSNDHTNAIPTIPTSPVLTVKSEPTVEQKASTPQPPPVDTHVQLKPQKDIDYASIPPTVSIPPSLPQVKSIYEQVQPGESKTLLPSFPQKKKHFLANCNQVKNEAHQMVPWIEFHLMVGVDYFYIYDHQSTDNLKEVLQPYIDKGQVEYIRWPDDLDQKKWNSGAGALFEMEDSIDKCVNKGVYNYGCQQIFYADCIARSSKTSDYVAYFDVDEFFYVSLPKHVPQTLEYAQNSLKTFLQYFPYDNLRVSGPMFGGVRAELNDLLIDLVRLHEAHEGFNDFGSSHMFKSISRHRKQLAMFTNGHESRYGPQRSDNKFAESCPMESEIFNDGYINIEKQFAPDPIYGMVRFHHYRFSELDRKKKYHADKYKHVDAKFRAPFMKCTCDHIAYLIPLLKQRLDAIEWKYSDTVFEETEEGKKYKLCDWCDSVPFMDYMSSLELKKKTFKNDKYKRVKIQPSTYPNCQMLRPKKPKKLPKPNKPNKK